MQIVTIQRIESKTLKVPNNCPTGNVREMFDWLKKHGRVNVPWHPTWEDIVVDHFHSDWQIMEVKYSPQFKQLWRPLWRKVKTIVSY